jgi:glycosyltransferase involved in cell wall biosynthesis
MTGLDQLIGREVIWLEKHAAYSWNLIGQTVPKLFIHTGWNNACFNTLASEVRRLGGRVVGMVDNSFKGTLRQHLGGLIYRLFIARRFSAVWVPGASGRRLMRSFGVPDGEIYEGQYGADPDTFKIGPFPNERPKEILYVGQFIRRKAVGTLVEAFRESELESDGWSLRLLGDGPLRPKIRRGDGIVWEGFCGESGVGAAMRRARIFVLPSIEEHWGVVLAEAGLSGCILASSAAVGAAADLVSDINGVLFKGGDVPSISKALLAVSRWDEDVQRRAWAESRRRAERFGPKRWASEFASIVAKLGPANRSGLGRSAGRMLAP